MTKTIVSLFAIGVLLTAAAPASAAKTKMMSCNAADMAKANSMMMSMADGPNRTTVYKEIDASNTAMSKGDMKGCAKHLNMAAKAGTAK